MDSPDLRFAGETLSGFRRALRSWYRRHARPLPWRQSADPYRIWISEIMLQQTTVAAVVPYFERFLARFPSVESLAAAGEDDVLRLWEGLGYYSRARNIHRTARLIARERAGRFPEDVGGLQDLPGIGRYTAGAIASFAFDQAAPIVEANTLRLYCRLLGYREDPRSARGQRLLWQFAERIVPAASPGRFNQALMELGATVCTPQNPDCARCPVRRYCAASTHGRQAEIPLAALRPALTDVTEVAVAIRRNGRFFLRQRPAGERWAGLWDFVRFAIEPPLQKNGRSTGENGQSQLRPRDLAARASPRASRLPHHVACRLSERVKTETGLDVELRSLLAEIRHGVTRYRITLQCYLAEWLSGEPHASLQPCDWVAPRRMEKYPLSMTGRKLAQRLKSDADR